MDTAAPSDVAKSLDARRVGYRPATTLDQSCSGCVFFDGGGYCQVVAGAIRPDYVCDRFTPVGTEGFDEYDAARWVPGGEAVEMSSSVPIAKSDDDAQLVFGWANIAADAMGVEVVDSHGDSIPGEELEFAAYEFVLSYGLTGDEHQGQATGRLVESFFLSAEKADAMGLTTTDGLPVAGWWVGFHIEDPATYALVKSGERPMFSIQGRAYDVQAIDEGADRG